jgi:hypothetical protein
LYVKSRMKGDLHVRFCESLLLKYGGLLDPENVTCNGRTNLKLKINEKISKILF